MANPKIEFIFDPDSSAFGSAILEGDPDFPTLLGLRVDKPFEDYSNLRSLLSRPSIESLDDDAIDLIQDVMTTALDHSRGRNITYNQLSDDIFAWEERLRNSHDFGIIQGTGAYTTSAVVNFKSFNGNMSCGERESGDMKRYVPLPFAVFGALFLALFCIFTVFLVFGVRFRIYVINPWYNIMLFVASFGLLATDIVAIFESRKRLDRDDK